ncbi:MAG: response regulator [Anaerolineae bacterium]
MHLNVLILDDSSAMLNTLDSILTSHGYRVESYSDCEACWQRLVAAVNGRMSVPDLLLLDLNMPGLDGLMFLGRIRAQECLARMAVLVLLAKADAGTCTCALGAGANDYLTKPVDLSELLERVAILSARQKGRASAVRIKQMQ